MYSNLVFKTPQPNDSIQKYKRILNYGFEISGWHNGVKYTFDVCTPVIFHELLSPYENISLIFWFVKIQLQLHIPFDNIVGGRHNEP